MKDDIKLAQMKREFDALKIELGVATNNYTQLKKEMHDQYKVKSFKEANKLLTQLESELDELQQECSEKFSYIEEQLKKYRR